MSAWRLIASVVHLVALGGTASCSGNPRLRPELASASTSALTLSDALEDLIAQGKDTDEDRDAAYDLVQMLPADTAGDAFGHAAVAGRAAETKGAAALFSDKNPTSLVAEAEQFALRSRDLDESFREGAATRMLGTLYVRAPGDMLKHGDSEVGLELLEHLTAEHPDLAANQLRLAEAYITLSDKDAAREPLCKAVAKKTELRRDDQALLDRLLDDMKPFSCAQK